jgi:hypothetical protein
MGSLLLPRGLRVRMRDVRNCRVQGVPRPYEVREAGRRARSGYR